MGLIDRLRISPEARAARAAARKKEAEWRERELAAYLSRIEKAIGMARMIVTSHDHTFSYINRIAHLHDPKWVHLAPETIEDLGDGLVRYPLSGLQVSSVIHASALLAGVFGKIEINILERARAVKIYNLFGQAVESLSDTGGSQEASLSITAQADVVLDPKA